MLDLALDQIGRAAVTASVPLVLAGCGELVAERAGVINIGIEGLMLCGCISGFAVTVATGSCWLGLAGALAAGVAFAALFAVCTVYLRVDQIVAGMAINLLAVGFSGTIWQVLQNHPQLRIGDGQGFERGCLPGSIDLIAIPVLGPLLFDQYGLCYATMGLACALHWALARTRAGIVIRALGEAPDACAAQGFDVLRWRMLCLLFAGACCGLAGAYLSIMRTHSFVTLMTGGKGFVVLALVIFGRWSVDGLVLGSLCFGLLDSLQESLQGSGWNHLLPYQALQVLPYAVALIALAALGRGGAAPAQLGQPWPRRT